MTPTETAIQLVQQFKDRLDDMRTQKSLKENTEDLDELFFDGAKDAAILHCEEVIVVIEETKQIVDESELMSLNQVVKHHQQIIEEIKTLTYITK